MTRATSARLLFLSLLAIGAAACQVTTSTADDATTPLDGGVADAGAIDAGLDAGTDAGPVIEPGPARAVFVLPRTGDEAFFDLPWPSDWARAEDGTLDVSRFPDPTHNEFVEQYKAAVGTLRDGFATDGCVYLRFSRPIDPDTLPETPQQTMMPTSSVQLVVADADSPMAGQRWPAVVVYQEQPTRYWPANSIAVRPMYGFPLLPSTTYAVVVTDALTADDGRTFARDADFTALMAPGGDSAVQRARTIAQPALDALRGAGVDLDRTVSLSVFTTMNPVSQVFAAADWIRTSFDPPQVLDDNHFSIVSKEDSYWLVEGRMGPSPRFQQGNVPYLDPEDGGDIQWNADGTPVLAGTFETRFALSLPKTEVPARGWPVVLYAHGTGGDYLSFAGDGTADRLARLGFAVLSVDMIHHGDRNPSDYSPELLFFNFTNPHAARDNNRQSALDFVQLARLPESLEVTANRTPQHTRVRLDPTHLYFFGHSQGGLIGPLFFASSPQALGGVLSGAGSTLPIALMEKTAPVDIPALLVTALGTPGSSRDEKIAREALRFEHPLLTLLQTWIEPSDPVNYAPYMFRTPREGFAPRSILQTEGLHDEYAPPLGIEALAVSAGIPLVDPVARAIPGLEVRGLSPLTAPVSADVADGRATAGLLQFPDDGHFPALDNEVAIARWSGFMSTLLADGIGQIPPPP